MVIPKCIRETNFPCKEYSSFGYFYNRINYKKTSVNLTEVFLVRPKGFEPPAPGVGGQCSIQLSYGRLCMKNAVTAYFNLVK